MNKKEQLEELARVRDSLKTFREREADLSRELGEDPVQDITTSHREEEENASLFDELTSAELMHLYQNDRERWKRIMDAKQSAGERKLMKLN